MTEMDYTNLRSFDPLPPRHTQFDTTKNENIDLWTGGPSRDLLPRDLLRASAALALSKEGSGGWAEDWAEELDEDPTSLLQYGPVEGDSTFRTLLAQLLASLHGPLSLPPSPNRIIVTPGASVGLLWTLLSLTRPYTATKRAWVPKSTYFLMFKTLRDVGFRTDGEEGDRNVYGVDEDGEGIIVEDLERQLQAYETAEGDGEVDLSGPFRHILYLVPTHSNPTGTTISLKRREALVKLAVKYHILIVCDDVYEHLSYGDGFQRPARMAECDVRYGEGKNVISNCSFSKVLGPGVRCGWIEAHPSLTSQICANGSFYSGGAAHLTSRLLLPLLMPSAHQHLPLPASPITSQTPLETHLSKICETHSQRLLAILSAINTHLIPLGLSLPYGAPKGGYFLWLEFPAGMALEELKEACEREQVVLGWGHAFLLDSPGKDDPVSARICWAFNGEDKLSEGIQRLGRAVRRVSASKS